MDEEMINRELRGVKSAVDGLRSSVDGLHAETADSRAISRRTIATLVRLEGKMDDMAERMATKDDLSAHKSAMDARFDDAAKSLDDMRFRWAVHSDTLVQHDKRLKKLEARRS